MLYSMMMKPDIDEYHNVFLNNMVEYTLDMNKDYYLVLFLNNSNQLDQ